MTDEPNGHLVNQDGLPADFPTHRHADAFWAELGRTVATFGFLEQTLGKAIFGLTATQHYEEAELGAAYEAWLPKLKRAVSDPLGGLIDTYAKALKDNPDPNFHNPKALVDDLRAASALRNVLCHGSWGVPDADGKSLPFFVTPKMMIFTTPIDIAHLRQTRAHVVELICTVINSVTHRGWQFPGSSGPGDVIFRSAHPD